jgi:2,3-bisphosphoglycerate-independent phosphoglycerate mutase
LSLQKYVVFIADGCADLPLDALEGKTPLEAAELPNIDALARQGIVGRANTIPEGVAPGSDTAILSIFGYDPRVHYTGRSPLEAAGSGVKLRQGNLSFRLNLAGVEDVDGRLVMRSHSGGNIAGDEALSLMGALMQDDAFLGELSNLGMSITVSPSFRHVAVMERSPGTMATTPPHEIVGKVIDEYLPTGAGEALRGMMLRSYEVLREHPVNIARVANGQLAANMAWPWGEGGAVELPSFDSLYGKRAAAISAVPLVWGIANLAGVDVLRVPTATGDLHTDYRGKAEAAVSALCEQGYDCAILHVEAPDECSHDGDVAGKIQAMENIDGRMIPRLLDGVRAAGHTLRLLLLSDHYTLLSTRGHDGTPVPYLLYDSEWDSGQNMPYCEKSALGGPMVDPATGLLKILFGK